MTDLFETPELIPAEVQNVLDSWDQDGDPYKECTRLEIELAPLGYTFEWGLDGEPYNLQKIEDKYQYLGQNAFNQPVYLEPGTGKRLFGNLFARS